MINKSYTYNEMQELIKVNKAKIVRKSQKLSKNNHYRCLVECENNQYLLCGCCDLYLHIDSFTLDSKNKLANRLIYCKQCRRNTNKQEYSNDFSKHLYSRYKSIIQKSIKYGVPYLSYNEFITFAKTVKEPIFELTLEDAFYKNMSNGFEIEHSHPISKGGNSLLNNLTLMHKSFNRFKGTMTLEDTLYFAKLIVKHENKIRKSYHNKQI
ncbi:hypothetical protein ACXAT3_002650 [Clostridium sporogenes]